LIHRVQPSRQHRLEQLFLASEVIVDGGEVDIRGGGDRPQARRLETVLHEKRFGGVEYPVFGRDRGIFADDPNHASHSELLAVRAVSINQTFV
jgi:hypothetical protein